MPLCVSAAEPVVTHGGTLTSTITFRECVQAVHEAAFVASPYPVILTLENHCSLPFQKQQADILHEVLRDSLFVPPGTPRCSLARPLSVTTHNVRQLTLSTLHCFHCPYRELSTLHCCHCPCRAAAGAMAAFASPFALKHMIVVRGKNKNLGKDGRPLEGSDGAASSDDGEAHESSGQYVAVCCVCKCAYAR